MGAALAILGRFEEAVPWLSEAITLRPDFPTPLFTLAIALAHLGRIDEAKAALARFETLASLQSFIETSVATRGWSDLALSALRRLRVDLTS
jgi:tetratricopeptide (TPR) repeat protein